MNSLNTIEKRRNRRQPLFSRYLVTTIFLGALFALQPATNAFSMARDAWSPPSGNVERKLGEKVAVVAATVTAINSAGVGLSLNDVIFARIGKGKTPETALELWTANYRVGNTFYIFNARPGRYMLVATCDSDEVDIHGWGKGLVITINYGDGMKMSLQEAKPGVITYLGAFKQKRERRITGRDPLVRYYLNVVNRTYFTGDPNDRENMSAGSLNPSGDEKKKRKRFFDEAKTTLQGTDWESFLDATGAGTKQSRR